jgi:hypothetical protein
LRWTGQVKEKNKHSAGVTGGNLKDREENWAMNIFRGVCDKKHCRHHKLRSFKACQFIKLQVTGY